MSDGGLPGSILETELQLGVPVLLRLDAWMEQTQKKEDGTKKPPDVFSTPMRMTVISLLPIPKLCCCAPRNLNPLAESLRREDGSWVQARIVADLGGETSIEWSGPLLIKTG